MPSLPIPADVARLFWDIDPATLDLEHHGDYVLERVMTRGNWAAMSWLRATYSRDVLAEFLHRKGSRLGPRDLAYWCLVAGVRMPQSPGGARPPWAGPV
jgi:hypothetical protein